MLDRDTAIHLVAGGAGGTTGAIVTCPLEVVKTRLQSSVATFSGPPRSVKVGGPTFVQPAAHFTTSCSTRTSQVTTNTFCRNKPSVSIITCFKHIIQTEGPRALFKGLGANLIGVAPSRAIYFCTYSQMKRFLNSQPYLTPDTPIVHICSAAFAGFTACTVTNPIWYVKTRVQLNQSSRSGTHPVRQCVRDTYRQNGWKGFYKGVTASYVGISETVIHFVIYEALKARLMEIHGYQCNSHRQSSTVFLNYMLAGAFSKTIASTIAYPHEVVRTRLREEGTRYKTFFQTLSLVAREEGHRGLYRGLVTQLIRQIPNTAIMMATYEAVVHVLQNVASDDGYG